MDANKGEDQNDAESVGMGVGEDEDESEGEGEGEDEAVAEAEFLLASTSHATSLSSGSVVQLCRKSLRHGTSDGSSCRAAMLGASELSCSRSGQRSLRRTHAMCVPVQLR